MTLKASENKYGASIKVTDGPFGAPRFIFATASNKKEALHACVLLAEQENWVPPRWWQWWRRKDSKEPYVSELL